MAAHHFRARYLCETARTRNIIERGWNAGDLVNESSRGSHTFTCPILFFPTFVPSMRESQGWCTLLSLTRFRVSREVGGRGEVAVGEMTRRLDQIPRETFIPKLLPIRGDFVRGVWGDSFRCSSIDREGLNISSKKKKSWKSFVRNVVPVRLFNNLLQIFLSRISKNLAIFEIRSSLLQTYSLYSFSLEQICLERNCTGFVSQTWRYSPSIYSPSNANVTHPDKDFSTVKSTCVYARYMFTKANVSSANRNQTFHRQVCQESFAETSPTKRSRFSS